MKQLKYKLPYVAEFVLNIVPEVKYIYVHGKLFKNQFKNIYLVIPDKYRFSSDNYYLLMFELERMFLKRMKTKTHFCFQYEDEYLVSKKISRFVKKVISKGYLVHNAGEQEGIEGKSAKKVSDTVVLPGSS